MINLDFTFQCPRAIPLPRDEMMYGLKLCCPSGIATAKNHFHSAGGTGDALNPRILLDKFVLHMQHEFVQSVHSSNTRAQSERRLP